jgi:hypothetical protein
MTRFLMIKIFSHTGYLLVQYFSPFMIVSSEYGEPKHIYGGIYTVGGHSDAAQCRWQHNPHIGPIHTSYGWAIRLSIGRANIQIIYLLIS